MKYIKITKTGELYLERFLLGKIDTYGFAMDLAKVLIEIKKAQNNKGLSPSIEQGGVSSEILLAYESLKANGLIEEIGGSLEDTLGGIVNNYERKLDWKEKMRNWRMGLGPPPDLF